MAVIEVIFSNDPDPRKRNPRIVQGVCPVVHSGENIHWHFSSANTKLTDVGIKFQDDKATFFPEQSAGEQHVFKREVGPHKNAHIRGRVPWEGLDISKLDKYSILGWVKGDEKEPSLETDPEIFTKKP